MTDIRSRRTSGAFAVPAPPRASKVQVAVVRCDRANDLFDRDRRVGGSPLDRRVFNSFSENEALPNGAKPPVWFALNESRRQGRHDYRT
jgi:hypothetical protein